mmetsp:Transcript_29198/g.64379  ORF Transcript_29198/g.64379 Transcript_29198/m.64379 type:complete len:428 (-) Transcript_29198:89-1372(-)|eukprot:CAMPEP_0178497884 /NCGR_PEP_ID=MMETSP0696-20121128/14938_1 /TAXON_ID=265572 /ORGANISM="Extubocellulus spinifer, Strain CCMP396" /LENGTH=427 /DNA_ID=CAMNT_0020126363 /DNA_START=211 /DNA_END=1494 /DNA_ORIENTATION=+
MGVSLRRRRSGKKDVIQTDPQQQQSSVPISQEYGTSTGTRATSSRSTRGRSLTRSVSAKVSRSLSRSRSTGSGGPGSTSPGGRRRSLSLSRRRSRSRSNSRATDADGRDGDVNADARVMSSIGLSDRIDDDFLFEDSLHYDPAKHGGHRDNGTSWVCDPADSDGRRNGGVGGGGGEGGATLGVMMAKCFNDTEDACMNFCHSLGACCPPSQDKRSGRNRRSNRRRGRCYGGEGTDGNSTLASFSSLESNTLATNTVPLKKKESKLAAYLRRSKSPAKNRKQGKTRDGGSGRRRRSLSRGKSRSGRDDGDRGRSKGSAAAVAFNPYGDDEVHVPTTNMTPSPRRSKSKERQKVKWNLSKGKKKNSSNDSAKSPQSVADVSDWRCVRDDVLSGCEQGQFITYEAGRVRSSTKQGGDGGHNDAFDRFLYL